LNYADGTINIIHVVPHTVAVHVVVREKLVAIAFFIVDFFPITGLRAPV
jgi:hypothetical protein